MSSINLKGQNVPVINYKTLSSYFDKQDDTTYVFNFWATWCRPCVKELPYFDALSRKYENQKIKVMLVSLDFVRELNSRLEPFVKENKIISPVFLLDEPDYNSWIVKVDKSWSGAIPATLIINNKNGIRNFYETEFTEEELNKLITKIIY
jgi:thiol-disulfide isomerase/thioredoxin